jgi:group I intron endonuclease
LKGVDAEMIVYKATCIINNKSYIGQTKQNFDFYIKKHIKASIRDKNKRLFYNAIKKYGHLNFQWSILEHCNSKEEMDEMEYHYIMQYDTYRSGYNMTLGGEGVFGKIITESTRQKMRENHADVSGENNPMYGISISGPRHHQYGKHRTEEVKRKLREANLGKTMSNTTKQKISASTTGQLNHFYGEKHTESTRQKMRENHADVSGENNPMYGKGHLIEGHKNGRFGKKLVNKNGKNVCVKKEDLEWYLKHGWNLGYHKENI